MGVWPGLGPWRDEGLEKNILRFFHRLAPRLTRDLPPQATTVPSVQVFGRKKTATAVSFCKKGNGLLKINGSPLALLQPEVLRTKVEEPLLIIGKDALAGLDIRVRVTGGGHTAQLYGAFLGVGMVALIPTLVCSPCRRPHP